MLFKRCMKESVWTRRIVAAIAAICLLFARYEMLIPDVHDGSTPVVRALELSTEGVPRSDLPAPAQGHHVDHCTHTHNEGVLVSSTVRMPMTEAAATAPHPLALQSEFNLIPRTRPPIA